MAEVQSDSGGEVTLLWWELLSSADGVGLISLESAPAAPDLLLLRDLARRLDEAGVARRLVVRLGNLDALDRRATAEVVRGVLDALRGSPLPRYEWPALTELFGAEELARLLQISESSLNRYARGARATPDVIAERLHFIALIVGDLRGAYNEVGVRRWFHRPRSALEGSAPLELLPADWTPDDPGPAAVRDLARSLVFAAAT